MIQHSAGWHIESLELGNLLYYLKQESLGSIEWDSLFQYTRWGNQGKHQILTSVLINTCVNMHITHTDTCTLHTLNDTSIHMYTSMHTKVMIKTTRKSTAWIPPLPRFSPFHRLSQGNQAGLQWSTQIHPVECQDYFVLSDISLPLFILPITRTSSRLLLLFVVQLFCLLSLLLTFQYCSKIDQ